MRLGLSGGMLPLDAARVDEELAADVARRGFRGIATQFGMGSDSTPADVDTASCRRARDIFAAHGVRIVQSWSWRPNLVHPDADERRRQVELLAGAMRVAADQGAEMVVCGSGSRNPRGGFFPHRDNHTDEARALLVESLAAAAEMAEDHGVTIALEPHVATTLDTPARVREVIDLVGSPRVRANLDPVNFVGDLRRLHRSADLVDEVFDALGDVAVSGHVKDVLAEDKLVVSLSETVIGDGEFDNAAYVRRFEERLPDAFLFIEHLPADQVPRAQAALERLLTTLQIDPR